MAKSLTTRLGLQRWTADADTQDRTEFDGAHAQLEQLAAGYLRDLIANRPAAAATYVGFLFEATDEAGALYWCTGSAWLGPFALVSDLDAAEVVFDPTGLAVVTGTDVQEAIAELDAAADSGSSESLVSAGEFEVSGLSGASRGVIGARWPAWLLDASVAENVAAGWRVPAGWTTVHVDVLWSNPSTGTGDVRWSLGLDNAADGGDLAASGSGGAAVAAAPSQAILKVTRIATSVAVTEGNAYNVRLTRDAHIAADTLANDAAVLGVLFTKAS